MLTLHLQDVRDHLLLPPTHGSVVGVDGLLARHLLARSAGEVVAILLIDRNATLIRKMFVIDPHAKFPNLASKCYLLVRVVQHICGQIAVIDEDLVDVHVCQRRFGFLTGCQCIS